MKEKDFTKRLVELAEGFSIIKASRYIIGDGYTQINMVVKGSASWAIDEIKDWALYPLLLYRAMENIESIEIEWHGIAYCIRDDNVWNRLNFRGYQPTKYLTPQEQALEDALKKVLNE